MRHETLEDSVVILENDKIWSTNERKEIIERARQIYMNKRRTTKLVGEECPRGLNDERGMSSTDCEENSDDDGDLDTEDDLQGCHRKFYVKFQDFPGLSRSFFHFFQDFYTLISRTFPGDL